MRHARLSVFRRNTMTDRFCSTFGFKIAMNQAARNRGPFVLCLLGPVAHLGRMLALILSYVAIACLVCQTLRAADSPTLPAKAKKPVRFRIVDETPPAANDPQPIPQADDASAGGEKSE